MKKIKLLIFSLLIIILGSSHLVPHPSYAEVNIGEEFNLIPKQCIKYQANGRCLEYADPQSIKSNECYQSIGSFITCILPNLYIIAGVILLVILSAAGLIYLFSAGNSEKQAESSKAIGATLLGFVILFASYWIIQIIQVILGIKILDMTFLN